MLLSWWPIVWRWHQVYIVIIDSRANLVIHILAKNWLLLHLLISLKVCCQLLNGIWRHFVDHELVEFVCTDILELALVALA